MRAWALIVRWQRWIWLVLGLAGLLLAARAVAGSRAELFAVIRSLRQVSWIWLGVAAVAEGGAFTALASPQRRMLRPGGVNVGVGALARLAVASQAMGSVLPAGYLVSDVVPIRFAGHGLRDAVGDRRAPRASWCRLPAWRSLPPSPAAGTTSPTT